MTTVYINRRHLHYSFASDTTIYYLHANPDHIYKRHWSVSHECDNFLKGKDFEFNIDPLTRQQIIDNGKKISENQYILTMEEIIDIQKPRLEFKNNDDALLFKLSC